MRCPQRDAILRRTTPDENRSILVSFCNVWKRGAPPPGSSATPEGYHAEAPFMLAVYHPDGHVFQPLISSDHPLRLLGITGLAKSDDYIFVATQAGLPLDATGRFFTQSYLFIFARHSLALLSTHPFQRVKDAHSVCYCDGRLYIASSGTDEIVELRLDGHAIVSEEAFWRFDPEAPAMDVHHLNGVCSSPDGLIVTGFGKRSGDTRRWASNGFVFNLTQNQMLASALEQPHSPIGLGRSSIAYCESSKRTVRIVGDNRQLVLPGYSRGICKIGSFLYVGTSIRRTMSRSTGAPVVQVGGDPADPDLCTISCFSAADWSLVSSFTLADGISELYDLMPLADEVPHPG